MSFRSMRLPKLFDGFSIGSNDLTAADARGRSGFRHRCLDFDERDPGMMEMIRLAVVGAKRNGRHVGICGEAPANCPEVPATRPSSGLTRSASILRRPAHNAGGQRSRKRHREWGAVLTAEYVVRRRRAAGDPPFQRGPFSDARPNMGRLHSIIQRRSTVAFDSRYCLAWKPGVWSVWLMIAAIFLLALELTGAQTAGRERVSARHRPFGARHPAKQASS